MKIEPLRTDTDHEAVVRQIEALWAAEEGTAAGERLDVLVALADEYENRRWPLPPRQ